MRPAAWLQPCPCSRSGGILALLIAGGVWFGFVVDVYVIFWHIVEITLGISNDIRDDEAVRRCSAAFKTTR